MDQPIRVNAHRVLGFITRTYLLSLELVHTTKECPFRCTKSLYPVIVEKIVGTILGFGIWSKKTQLGHLALVKEDEHSGVSIA